MLLMALTSFVLVLPALIMGDAINGDIPVHVRWQAQFAELVWSGTPYPRWLPDMNQGFGSPAFFFYPPLIQWLGALFQPLLPGSGHAASRLVLAVWVISAAGGVGCWRWLCALRLAPHSAIFGGLVFLLMPYRCFVDVYQRGALAELAGMCVMPWLLCFATGMKAGRPGAWGGYALATGVMFYSHLPAALMGILFATGYVLVLAGRRNGRFVLRAAAATVVGIMIGALCIATALGLLHLITDTTAMWGPRNQPMNWLLFSSVRWDDTMHAMTLAMIVMALVVGTLLAVPALGTQDPQARRVVLFLVLAILVVIFLNTAPSRPFWALQTPLSRIQFPFRLLSIHVVALSGLAAIAHHRFASAAGRRAALRARLLWLGVPGLLLLDASLLAIQNYRNRDERPPTNQQMIASNVDSSEYVPGQMAAVSARFGAASSYALSGSATSRPLVWNAREIALAVDAATPSRLALRQFAFTGWQCRVDGGPWQGAATIPYPLNVAACAVPAGRHLLEARMPATWIERAGGLLTLGGLILALTSLAGAWRSSRTSRKDAARPPGRALP
ncbi:hypothetical protein BH10PSE14_BH10PSE14_31510 [soil metagenome]